MDGSPSQTDGINPALNGYIFKDPLLLEEALTHPSMLVDGQRKRSYQRLEFLGDSVIQLTLADKLFRAFPDGDEGLLTRSLALLVNQQSLAKIGREQGLPAHMMVSEQAKGDGVPDNDSALSDVVESVIAAVFVDGGYEASCQLIDFWFSDFIQQLDQDLNRANPKGQLQERLQGIHGNVPITYELIRQHGPSHNREFEMAVLFQGETLGRGTGRSKKLAEEAAALEALGSLNDVET